MNLATGAPRTRRLRVDAARNQQRILEAARELFAEHGLEITLDDVAERAGVGVGTVYRRFSNKRELIAEVFAERIGEFAQAAEQALETEDPWDAVVWLVEYACRHMATNRGFSEVILELGEDIARFDCQRQRIAPAITALVQRAQAAGVLQPGIETSDVFALIHMVDSLAEFTRPVDPDVWRRYMAIALNGIRAEGVARQPFAVDALSWDQLAQAREAKPVPLPGRRR